MEFSTLKFADIGIPRRRRAALAFITGSALFVMSAAALISDGASARGPGGLFTTIFAPAETEAFAGHSGMADAGGGASQRRPRHRRASSAAVNLSSRRPVCVRLCDGFFFPVSDPAGASGAASEQAACESLCPDAPVALYYQPSGSDDIEEASSVSGQLYAALPIALRYRAAQDSACSCHRSLESALDPLLDPTLRKGDAVMTPKGFLVFRGVEQAKHSSRDFSALASAALPPDQRTTLRALERVSLAPQRGPTRSWIAAATLVPPAIASARIEISDKIRFVERSD